MRYQDPWKKSIFAKGQMGLMAVCEIAKGHPDLKNMPNPCLNLKKKFSNHFFFQIGLLQKMN